MGLARLDDAEFARRARERNSRVNAAHRQRLLEAGKAQTNVWLSAELRQRLDSEAAAAGVNLSTVVEKLLSAALANSENLGNSAIAENSPIGESAIADNPPVESVVDRDRRIIELHQQGVPTREIAKQVGCSKTTAHRVTQRLSQTGEKP